MPKAQFTKKPNSVHQYAECGFTHSNGYVYLELIGEKTNVEIAEYIAHFLNQKLDILWTQTQFNALIKFEKHLIESAHHIYPNLRTTKRAVTHHEIATPSKIHYLDQIK